MTNEQRINYWAAVLCCPAEQFRDDPGKLEAAIEFYERMRHEAETLKGQQRDD